MLMLIGYYLYWYVDRSYESYLDSQQALMQQSTRGAARTIELYIKEVRQRVDLFAEEEGEIISNLSAMPADEEIRGQFGARVKRHFPDLFAYTITDEPGRGSAGRSRRQGGRPLPELTSIILPPGKIQNVFIHPNPIGYHFDIMSYWQACSRKAAGIFFVSLESGGPGAHPRQQPAARPRTHSAASGKTGPY